MATPTDRQRDVLRAIHSYQLAHGYAPTNRDLRGALGISSSNGVSELLERLERKELLRRLPRGARTLQLTPAGLREVA